MKLTKARRRWLATLGGLHQDACFTLECIDRGYHMMPLFRARLRSVPCPTCGHPTQEQPVTWEVVEGLADAGLVSERITGSGSYYLTDAGRRALSNEAES